MKKLVLAASAGIIVATVATFFIFYSTNNQSELSENQSKLSNVAQTQKIENPSIKVLGTKTILNATDPSLSINPKTGIIYASYYKGTGQKDLHGNEASDVFLIKSSDNGNTFSEPTKVNDKTGDATSGGYTNPMQFGPNGEVYVEWQQIQEDPNFYGVTNIRLAKSLDGGSSFEPAIDPAKGLPTSEKLFPELAVSKTGTIVIPYINNEFVEFNDENGTKITYRTDNVDLVTQMPVLRSEDGGKTFQQFILDKDMCQCCDIASTVGPDGEIYFAWRTSDREYAAPNDPEHNKHVKYLNNYNDTEYLKALASYDPAGKEAYDKGLTELPNKYSTARDIVVAHSVDGGRGLEWSEPVRVQEKQYMFNGCISIGPGIKFDSQGRLHVSYFTGAGEDGKMGYYYVNSDDNGKTWSKPTSLFSADYMAPLHNGAALTVDENDNVWVSFMMLKDYQTTDNVWSSGKEYEMELNVYALDRSGKILDKKQFDLDSHVFPSITATKQGTLLGYTNKQGAQLVSLELV
ncbi:MAG: sialidase family protein [Candidatus Nitrosotenuis sp.]